MRLVTLPDPACTILVWVWVVCCLSGFPKENLCARRAVPHLVKLRELEGYNPPGELSIDPVADERLMRVTWRSPYC
jgi:hypothetical protein